MLFTILICYCMIIVILSQLICDLIMQLYVEPINILKIPMGTEENPLQPPVPMSELSARQSADSAESKINGRLTLTEIQTAQLASVAEEGSSAGDSGEPCNAAMHRCNKKSQETNVRLVERSSDEKIIAEILKPEERIRLSKSSDKSLKVSGTNTAISLDS